LLGRGCGIDQYKAYPVLYWVQTNGILIPNQTVCITQCPESSTDTVVPAPGTHNQSKIIAYPSYTSI